jgi:1-deoxy-D-xylulose-5-phosphate reductoisomerase
LKKITILGSTGSIGQQALDVIRQNPDSFSVVGLTARKNSDKIIEQSREFMPEKVAVLDPGAFKKVRMQLQGLGIEVLPGEEGINKICQAPESDTVLTAMVGFSGFIPTITAIEAGKNIALANKETLVVGGGLIMDMARKSGVAIIPVDSEHSAIFQCLVGENLGKVKKIILTASGGPFRGYSREALKDIGPKQALKHPNWEMGAKITIDSATLMNKGLEAIEAKWLFDLDASQIEVVVHPQSIIHSMVEFVDGSVKAQLGLPDMRLPIHYSLGYPERVDAKYPKMDFSNPFQLDFEPPNTDTFENLKLAFEALKKGGNLPCVLNASNEIAVQGFLEDKLDFLGITRIVENCLGQISKIDSPNLQELVETDRETRRVARELIE